MANHSEVVQVVDENGVFNDQLEGFVQSSEVGTSGRDYQIVAITGPQSSGKSTLMNVLVRLFQEPLRRVVHQAIS